MSRVQVMHLTGADYLARLHMCNPIAVGEEWMQGMCVFWCWDHGARYQSLSIDMSAVLGLMNQKSPHVRSGMPAMS